jgi:putative transposase
MLASLGKSELARQVQYLKAENEILRAKLPKRMTVTPTERRRLLRLGRKIGPALEHLITIVTYRTFLRWSAGDKAGRTSGKRGRPRTDEEIREIIIRLAEENGWGYTRILGELKKLGIRRVCRSTVINILKAVGLDPGPQRGEGSWDEFLKIHAKTLWACDFLSKKVWTKWGLAEFFVLFFVHVGSRRVFVSGMTTHPDAPWVAQQARNFCMHLAERGEEASYLIHDRDTKFTGQFDALIESAGTTVKEPTAKSPNMNAFAERWAQTVQVECLDHFVVLGEDHLRYIVGEYVAYFNTERPHQAMDNAVLTGHEALAPAEGEILCRERLGGLLRHYYRQAA